MTDLPHAAEYTDAHGAPHVPSPINAVAVGGERSHDRTLTPAEYVAAFATWRAVGGANTPRRVVVDGTLRATIDDLVAGGCAAVLLAFPDGTARTPDAYCSVFAAFLGERPEEDAEAVRALDLAVRKSCLLSRLIYVGEPLRTRKCPRHEGRWSGIPWPGAKCTHGPDCKCASGCECIAPCGCATGWLP